MKEKLFVNELVPSPEAVPEFKFSARQYHQFEPLTRTVVETVVREAEAIETLRIAPATAPMNVREIEGIVKFMGQIALLGWVECKRQGAG